MTMINSSDKFLIEKLIEIRDRGYYANGRETTDLYNRVFGTNLSATSCSSCLRHRISLLEKELRRQEAEEAKALEESQVAGNKEVKEDRKEDSNGSKNDEQQTGKRLRRKKGNQA